MNNKDKSEDIITYNPETDTELIQDLKKVQKICFEYNKLDLDKEEEKKAIIKKLFKKTGNKFLIEPYFWCDFGNITIGENFYMNHNCVILDAGSVEFGDNVFIGPNCGFYTSEHMLNIKDRNKGMEYAKKIKIGNNVWIGGNVTVLAGVRIGDNVTIGAGSVVTKEIPSDVIAVGNPCKPIKKTPE
jgi:maltose O-acetyltransferase